MRRQLVRTAPSCRRHRAKLWEDEPEGLLTIRRRPETTVPGSEDPFHGSGRKVVLPPKLAPWSVKCFYQAEKVTDPQTGFTGLNWVPVKTRGLSGLGAHGGGSDNLWEGGRLRKTLKAQHGGDRGKSVPCVLTVQRAAFCENHPV